VEIIVDQRLEEKFAFLTQSIQDLFF